MTWRTGWFVATAGVALACGGDRASHVPAGAAVEAISLLGDSLVRPPLSDSLRAAHEAQLATARAAYERAPENVDSIVWLGRRTAYLGRYREAIEIYTRGLATHAGEPHLLRHRGHRFITIRQLDSAVLDLTAAARAAARQPDEVEPDGLPNARNQPRGTLRTNIQYHLGLARYLLGDYERAAIAFLRTRRTAENDDMRVAAGYWLYLTARRASLPEEAREVMAWVRPDLDVIENHTYHRLLLLYAGRLPVDSILPGGTPATLDDVTAAYGVAAWHMLNGRGPEAAALLDRILAARERWPAFGYIAAEADRARATPLSARSPRT